jgi:hypothetical protein
MRGVYGITRGLSLGLALCFAGCSSTRHNDDPQVLSSSTAVAGGAVISDEIIGRSRGAMVLSRVATDDSYGYSEASAVKVGGGFDQGSNNTYRFLNALRSPTGEPIKYNRVGTCCPFTSPNSPFGGEALLEVYEITVPATGKTKRLYFNWYDDAEVFIPVGLTASH